MHTYTHTHSHAHTHTQHTRMYTHTHMYIHSHTHTHTHTHTHINVHVQEFFTAEEDKGIKSAVMDKGMRQLRGVISLYRQTTEMLITDFIADEIKHVKNTGAMCGEVFLEIDAFLHPITGELDGTIRGREYFACSG